MGRNKVKHVIPILVVLLLVSSGFVGVSNTGEELMADAEQMEQATATSAGPMNSSWPMYCYDTRHTGRSPYSTADNPGDEKWRFKVSDWNEGGPAIDDNGTLYFGSDGGFLYALYANGTLKWKYRAWLYSVPAIAADGTIYVGSCKSGLHAIYPNGTRKWLFSITGGNKVSSPAIAEDGTIYFGSQSNNKVYAVNPDGTEKWNYTTGKLVWSSPAIGDDGTVYIGSDDHYLYALYPNGTLRWRFGLVNTDTLVRGSPSIAEDGTIYIGSLSLHDNNYLYALYPNGTMKWKSSTGIIWSSPSIGEDGTIYVGGGSKLYAIYPNNGTKKWKFGLGGTATKSSPAIDADGTIYIGTSIGGTRGGDLIAVNPDGTKKWRKMIANRYVQSSPAIGEDGTVYIVSSSNTQYEWYGYLHAFGIGAFKVDANGPYRELPNVPVQFTGEAWNGTEPYTWYWDFGDGTTSEEQNPLHTYTAPCEVCDFYIVTLTVTDSTGNTSGDITRAQIQENLFPPEIPFIEGPTSGTVGVVYNYTFVTWDDDGDDVYYYIEWGDGTNTGWIGPYNSGKEITESHAWNEQGSYWIRAKAKDIHDTESYWGYLEVTMPMNQQTQNSWFLQFLQNHPRMFPILRQLLGL